MLNVDRFLLLPLRFVNIIIKLININGINAFVPICSLTQLLFYFIDLLSWSQAVCGNGNGRPITDYACAMYTDKPVLTQTGTYDIE